MKSKQIKIAIQLVSDNIKTTKKLLLDSINHILSEETSEEHTFIELGYPVTINNTAESSEDIVRVYRDGGLVVNHSTQGRVDIDYTLEDLNVSQLFDLLIAIDENGTVENEIK